MNGIRQKNEHNSTIMKALLVIDLQNDFVSGSLAVPHGEEIIEPIIKLMEDPGQEWDAIVVTRDWHPLTHISFAKNHGLPDFSSYRYEYGGHVQDGTLWPVHCVQDTWGSELVGPLKAVVEAGEGTGKYRVVDKGYLEDREYYSAFSDIWGAHGTGLDAWLRARGVAEVCVAGLALDYCVKHTALSAARLGFRTTVLEPWTRPIHGDAAAMEALHSELAQHGVAVASDP